MDENQSDEYKRMKVTDYEISISKFFGKEIADLYGYVSYCFGSDTPVLLVTQIMFEDGTYERLEGEHDIVYIPADYQNPLLTEERLLELLPPEEGE